MKKIKTKNKKLKKDLKKVFFNNKDVLTDEEVEKELELGNKIIELLKEDLEEMKNFN